MGSYALNAQQQVPVGQWKEYLPYGSAIKVVAADNSIFSATPYSLLSYDLGTGEIYRFSKINGLSETGISTIAFDESSKKLLVAYTNSNVDLLTAGNIINISDIKRKNYAGDKNIYNIYFLNGLAYLSTGLGIIVINESKHETKDTYVIGNGGANIKVTGITSDQNFLYAASGEGLKRCLLNTDLADYHNWQTIAPGPVVDVVLFNNTIRFIRNDSLFSFSGTAITLIYNDGYRFTNMNLSSGKLLISENHPLNGGRIITLGPGGFETVLSFPGALKIPQQAIIRNNKYYVADLYGGLEVINPTGPQRLAPNSPFERSSGELKVFNNILYVPAGSVTSAWNYTYTPFGLFKFENNSWSYYNQYNYPVLDSVNDVLTVTYDRRNGDIYYGSFGGGLVRLSAKNEFRIYKQNSGLNMAIGDPGSYRVSGLAFDQQNNLWISNYGAAAELVVRKADSSWKNFTPPYTLTDNAVSQILIDDNDQKWIVSPKGNGLICLNTGNNIDNTNDDKWKLFRAGTGNGNLPDNQVFCVAKDKNGLIWIGTAKGVALIPCPNEVFTSTCEAKRPVVRQGAFAGYLLENDEVKTIVVDGANRKWVGTKNGLWLLSEDGEKVISHFTEDNSLLLNNEILSLAIDPQSGEVFIETFKGLCSFRGTATESAGDYKNLLVFPNPVPPNFDGLIAIRGLVNNAIVKITETNGRLVFETRALGGQAVWNGKNYKGEKVSSGAYLVLLTDESNQQREAGKIFIIR